MQRSAIISDCGNYRYELRRTWDDSLSSVLFVCLNPSTADATEDDQTSRVLMNYAKRWGYGGIVIANLFAYRSPDRSVLNRVQDPVGPENDSHLKRLAEECELTVCAWGEDGALQGRSGQVLPLLRAPHCLTVLAGGEPGHPLMKPSDLKPIPYRRECTPDIISIAEGQFMDVWAVSFNTDATFYGKARMYFANESEALSFGKDLAEGHEATVLVYGEGHRQNPEPEIEKISFPDTTSGVAELLNDRFSGLDDRDKHSIDLDLAGERIMMEFLNEGVSPEEVIHRMSRVCLD